MKHSCSVESRRPPHKLFLNNLFLIDFHLAGRCFKINSWLKNHMEHLIKVIKLLPTKSEVLL